MPEVGQWREFAAEYWMQKPGVLRMSLFAPLGQPDYFQALLDAAAAWKSGAIAHTRDIRILMGSGQVNNNRLVPLLPCPEDGDLAGYINRIEAAPQDGWNLVVSSLQQFSRPLFTEARLIADAIYRAAGSAPSGPTDCHFICGAYEEAPTRIHKDTATVVTYVILGRKRIWVWPYEMLLPYTRSRDALHAQVNLDIDFRSVADSATLLEGEPGDVLYWPADYWHCAESDGAPHASIHLASYTDGNTARIIQSVLSAALSDRVGEQWIGAAEYPGKPGDSRLSHLCDTAEQLLDSISTEIPARMQAKLLRRSSATNFEYVPPLHGARAFSENTLERPVAVDPRFPILYDTCVDDEGGLLIAINGHIARVQNVAWVQSFITALNATSESGCLPARDMVPLTSDASRNADRLSAAAALLAFALRADGAQFS